MKTGLTLDPEVSLSADVAASDIRAKSVGATPGYPEILLKSIKISCVVTLLFGTTEVNHSLFL